MSKYLKHTNMFHYRRNASSTLCGIIITDLSLIVENGYRVPAKKYSTQFTPYPISDNALICEKCKASIK